MIRHLKVGKDISYKKQFLIRWKEQFRKDIGVYEPLINISKLFNQKPKLKRLVF